MTERFAALARTMGAMQNIRWLSWALVAIASAPAAQAQQTVTQIVAGRSVALVVPKGFCLLERESTEGRTWYAVQDKLNEGRNKVLLVYVSCEELPRLKKDPEHLTRSHGSYLAALHGGKLSPVPPQYTRSRFLAEVKQALPKVADLVPGKVSERLKELDFDRELRLSGMHMGYLDEDPDVVYAGIGSWLESDQTKVRVIVVMGVTLLNGMAVSSNMYAFSDSKNNFSTLLSRQKSLMKLVLDQN